MYTVHTTPGFIIGSRDHGEAGKILSIFTRDFGLLVVGAQGVRFEKSKLRGMSQVYSIGEYSFIRGKELWRLTDAREIGNLYRLHQTRGSHILVSRIASFLRRLLHGEESCPAIFMCIHEMYMFLECGHKDMDQNLDALESLVVIRILHLLGYIESVGKIGECLQSSAIDREILDKVKSKRREINRHINRALRASHL